MQLAVNVLGINAVFHDPAAALVVDGVTVAAAEEERFSRRKHGKDPVAFSTWEVPVQAAQWCLESAGLAPEDVDVVAYSYDPALAPAVTNDLTADEWESLRTLYAARAPLFLAAALPGLRADRVRHVPHHVAHAASTWLASPHERSAVLVADGRGESTSMLLGHGRGNELEILARQALPHSLGLAYEELTAHLGFRRSSDEYKVMALAAYGTEALLPQLRALLTSDGEGAVRAAGIDWEALAPERSPASEGWTPEQADLACATQRRLEEVLLELASWLHERTGERVLTLAGGVALNCVANSRLWRESPFEELWVQPAAGDAGTALGAALYAAAQAGEAIAPMPGAALGRPVTAEGARTALRDAALQWDEPEDLAGAVADVLAGDGLVAWVQGGAEFGPRALGHRSLLADPRGDGNLERLNRVKGREQFRPVAPMVLAERAAEIFDDGPLPSPYMLFTHRVRPEWRDRIPAVVHVDGTARVQTVDPEHEPLMAAVLRAFEARTGVPVLVNTSLNTAGRPIVDSERDALECFGSTPIDLLALGPCAVRRTHAFGMAPSAEGAARGVAA